jgi:hypothetical protein
VVRLYISLTKALWVCIILTGLGDEATLSEDPLWALDIEAKPSRREDVPRKALLKNMKAHLARMTPFLIPVKGKVYFVQPTEKHLGKDTIIYYFLLFWSFRPISIRGQTMIAYYL